jgi:hypothetical protein
MEIPERIRERNLNAAPHERIGSAQDDQELMDELRLGSLRFPLRSPTLGHSRGCRERLKIRKEITNRPFQLRKLSLDDRPYDFEVDTEVIVNDLVAHPRDLLPRDLWLFDLESSDRFLTACPITSSLRSVAS